MFRRLGLALALGVLVAGVPSALAAFPGPMAAQGQPLLNADGTVQFTAMDAGSNTTVAMQDRDGVATRTSTIRGKFGIPMVTPNGQMGGLFRDGSAFVLQSMGYKPHTEFRIVRTDDLGVQRKLGLRGTFAFDALSPDGSRLYLIQHSSTQDIQHYVVRAYDLRGRRLLPGRIADKTQRGWVMQGFPATRTSTDDGRWVYTLYTNPGGYPFIHALDTVRGVAHCIGLPWRSADQGPVFEFTLTVKGSSLVVSWKDGRVYRLVDRTNWRLSKPTA
jgi:hypothetical protein